MTPFGRYRPGEKYRPTAQRENLVSDMLRHHQQQRFAPPSVRTSPPGGNDTTFMVTVTGYTSPSTLGGGKYWVKILPKPLAPLVLTGDLAATDFGDTSAVGEVAIGINALEIGSATHGVPVGKRFFGKVINTADNGMRVIEFVGWSSPC